MATRKTKAKAKSPQATKRAAATRTPAKKAGAAK